ncbi:MltF family protein [Afifella pfennigii]|uniref:transglycosylase SLT domain-containing protein n=1 Tax=Afifella pfennigii TaxID=209897 RepID=UPI001AEC57BA|nr:transporter substrate-binding domain-containing protein [Afifella pfennigii]
MGEALAEPWTGDLDGMRERGVIRMLVPFNRSYLFLDGGKFRGLALDFVREFEKRLNAGRRDIERTAIIVIPTARHRLLEDLVAGRGDIAVGNLTITPERRELVDFSEPILKDVTERLVTGSDISDVADTAGLSGLEIHVRPSSSYYTSLLSANRTLAASGATPIDIVAADEALEDEDLLEMVHAGLIPAIVVDDHKLPFWLQFFDGLKVHDVALREGGKIGWAMRKESTELAAAVNTFIAETRKGTLLGNILFKRYLESTEWLRRANAPENRRQLSKLRELFETYGKSYGVDWLLVAAQAYQESRFDQSLVSRAGAVGLMQIKPSTARDASVGIADITIAENNVHAGVKYLRYIADQHFADPELDEINRILFALASYNAGPNRIARLRRQAKDPNIWFGGVEWEVAREVGSEPVRYVRNIYRYYISFRSMHEGPAVE